MVKKLKNKIQLSLFVLCLLVSIALTIFHYRDSIFPPTVDRTGYVEIEAVINRAFESGRGIRRSTILDVRYTYEGKDYADTLRISGYTEGRFNKGDIIKRYIDPANPGELIKLR